MSILESAKRSACRWFSSIPFFIVVSLVLGIATSLLMIPKPYIAKWQSYAPWKEFYQIEQDLVISRVLIEIFSD